MVDGLGQYATISTCNKKTLELLRMIARIVIYKVQCVINHWKALESMLPMV